jgi:Ethanolamine utilization protein EutJ (predicted chaperonin)
MTADRDGLQILKSGACIFVADCANGSTHLEETVIRIKPPKTGAKYLIRTKQDKEKKLDRDKTDEG